MSPSRPVPRPLPSRLPLAGPGSGRGEDDREAAHRRLDALATGFAPGFSRGVTTPGEGDRPQEELAGDTGDRPERIPARVADPEEWDEPPWWRRVRWAPDRVAGVALICAVVVLGAVAVFRVGTPAADDVGVVAPPVPEPSRPAGAPADTGRSEPRPPPSPPAPPLVVSVIGLVPRSGLVTLTPGARVADALAAAGGTLPDADRDGLNLAQRLLDGQQVLVGVRPGGGPGARSAVAGPAPGAPAPEGGSPPQPGSPGSGAVATPGSVVDLNTADAAALDSLPGIGPSTAAAILAWRASHGRFTSVDQLVEVDGVGPATLAKLRPRVRV